MLNNYKENKMSRNITIEIEKKMSYVDGKWRNLKGAIVTLDGDKDFTLIHISDRPDVSNWDGTDTSLKGIVDNILRDNLTVNEYIELKEANKKENINVATNFQ